MLGMFSARDNEARLDRIETALKRRNLHPDERGELENDRGELRQWFSDLWRIEGGGSSDY